MSQEKIINSSEDYNQKIKNTNSRYMKDDRMRYLLASNTESLQQLIESQQDDMSRVLIELRVELDQMTRELEQKKSMCDEYDKKIKALQKMDEKTQKMIQSNQDFNDEVKESIKIKKTKKEEEIFQQKTLAKQVEKLNKDIFLIQKQIIQEENISESLNKLKEKARLESNKIRQLKNHVHSKIDVQDMKNKDDLNEQLLKIQYYETIIQQKYMFIQFGDERKERQKKIAEEAKNDTQDKEEVGLRRHLQLLLLYHKYLSTKNLDQAYKNESLENTYNKISDICGTKDIKKLVSFILRNKKEYNFITDQIKEREKYIDKLTRQIKKLRASLTALKSNVLVEEETSESKTVKPLQISPIEEEEKKLLETESELREKLFKIGVKHNEVNLAYNKILENINELESFQEKQQENNGDVEDAEQKCDRSQLDMMREKNDKEIEAKKEEMEEDLRIKEEENKREEGEIEKLKEAVNNIKSENQKLMEELKTDGNNAAENTQEGAINIEDTNKEKEGENDEMNLTQRKKEVELDEEEQNLLKRYEKFLNNSLNTFDVLFLIHSKDEFLNMMRQKGIKIYEEEQRQLKRAEKREKTNMSRAARKAKKLASLRVSTESNKNNDFNEEEDISNYDPDKRILTRFCREQKKEVEDFIYEKELAKKEADKKKNLAPMKK